MAQMFWFWGDAHRLSPQPVFLAVGMGTFKWFLCLLFGHQSTELRQGASQGHNQGVSAGSTVSELTDRSCSLCAPFLGVGSGSCWHFHPALLEWSLAMQGEPLPCAAFLTPRAARCLGAPLNKPLSFFGSAIIIISALDMCKLHMYNQH